MGSGMARNLLQHGHEVIVYNRTRERTDPLAAEGARVAPTAAEACDTQAVSTMVSDDAALDQVVFGSNGILGALRPGGVHVSHSTISTALARRLTAAHAEHGQIFVSAPVFGRPEAASAAQLLVVAAGPAAALDQLAPLFDAIGRKTVIAGAEPFQANAVKVCGNFMIASMIEAFGEAYATLRNCGVEPVTFLETMASLFRSPVYENYGKIIAEERFDPPGFALRLGLKDAKLTLATAEEAVSSMPFASIIRDHLITALAKGQGDLDWSSFAKR